MKKKILALCAAGLIFSLTGCEETMDPNDPQSVRRYLTKKQIGFTPNQFVSYAVNSDTAKMTLFLQASFEIDQPADNGNNAVARLPLKLTSRLITATTPSPLQQTRAT